jgi:hypothetical protein
MEPEGQAEPKQLWPGGWVRGGVADWATEARRRHEGDLVLGGEIRSNRHGSAE